MPNWTVEELRFDARARGEARAELEQMPNRDGHLNMLIDTQKQECLRATDRQRHEQLESWRYYTGEVDFSDKEEWQSQIWVPMPWSAVEQATTVMQRSMLDSSEFWGIKGVAGDPIEERLAQHVWKPTMDVALDKVKFIPKFSDAIKVALACGIGMYLKFRMKSFGVPTLRGLQMDPTTGRPSPVYEARPQSFLSLECVPPWHIYRDPRSRPREQWSGTYLMQEDLVDQPFVTAGRKMGFRNLEGLQPVGKTGAGGLPYGYTPEEAARRRGQTHETHEFRKPYQAIEWHGDVLDHNGDVIAPDSMMIRLNDKVVFGPVENPLWAFDIDSGRRKWPFIGLVPLTHPLRFEGWGILQAVTPLAVLFSNLFNLFSDGMNWKVNTPTEVDLSLLEDWEDTEHYPGKLWLKHGAGSALTPAQLGQMDVNAVLAALQFANQLFQNNSFVNDFIVGLPGNRSSITAREVTTKTQQSMGVFDGMSRNIEAGGRDAIELAHNFLHQYVTDWSDPSLAEIVGRKNAMWLQAMHPIERMQMLGGQFSYTFTGISAALQKSDLLGRILQMAQLAGQPQYLGLTKPWEVLGAIRDVMTLGDRIEVINPEEGGLPAMNPMMMGGMPGMLPPGVNGGGPNMRDLPPSGEELALAGQA